MLISYIPLVFVLIGLLMWGFGKDKLADAGRIMFAAAFLALMITLATKTVRLL